MGRIEGAITFKDGSCEAITTYMVTDLHVSMSTAKNNMYMFDTTSNIVLKLDESGRKFEKVDNVYKFLIDDYVLGHQHSIAWWADGSAEDAGCITIHPSKAMCGVDIARGKDFTG